MEHEYTWIFVVGIILCLFSAYGLGANDCANAFGTSVGSKSITIVQAVIIAGFCGFSGAVLMGSHVTSTVRHGIADPDAFKDDPDILMFGMLCVLFATGAWLILSCYLELPVSSTHSVVGGIIGIALVARGPKAVSWFEKTDSFPYCGGVVTIVASWFISPVVAALVSVSIFMVIYHGILKSEASVSRERALISFPIFVGITVAVGMTFILSNASSSIKFRYKGNARATVLDVLGGFWGTFGLSVGIGIATGIILYFFLVPHLRTRVERMVSKMTSESEEDQNAPFLGSTGPGDGQQAATPEDCQPAAKGYKFLGGDLHAVIKDDAKVEAVHDATASFDPPTEEAFSVLQVFTAMCVSFAHGANDVANAIGPLAAIYSIWKNGGISSNSDVPVWILVVGGFGIVLGLATYGYKIIQAVGIKLTKISPARGFSVEMGVATVITFGSRYGLPLSTTHCMVGGAVGVGLVQNYRQGVNHTLLLKVIFGWLITMIVVGATAGAMFAVGIYSPSIKHV